MTHNAGIVAAEVYFPKEYVSQAELEEFDGVAPGKYTIGLGQEKMSVVAHNEDIVSMSLTVLNNLTEKYGIDLKDVGRLEVGTESLVDKSKSVKTHLMELFNEQGVYDVLGADTLNACYGGTNALLNAVNWIQSRSYNGKYAVVICGDVAVYEQGPARPTGGAGAVALLIGPDAPITVVNEAISTYSEHAFDFYKPDMLSEYPKVDGQLSNDCYIRALDYCYNSFMRQLVENVGKRHSVEDFSDFIFHSPYTKLVQKSFSRINFLDYQQNAEGEIPRSLEISLRKFLAEENCKPYLNNKQLQKDVWNCCKHEYNNKVQPGLLLSQNCGNMYTASVYASLCSVISQRYGAGEPIIANSAPSETVVFSYGSGLIATMFGLRFRTESIRNHQKLCEMSEKLNLNQRLSERIKITPEEFTVRLSEREKYGVTGGNWSSGAPPFPGTYGLKSVDSMGRRVYTKEVATVVKHLRKVCTL